MVIGMAITQKVTITLSVDAVNSIRELVAQGKADNVSAFVQHAVRTALDDVTGWGAMLARALDETGGPMTADESAWADEVLGRAPAQGAA
jgi:Arc/MetJ-type ribon-helix-helix transcriptional regulator